MDDDDELIANIYAFAGAWNAAQRFEVLCGNGSETSQPDLPNSSE
jgi:hypothetical protein